MSLPVPNLGPQLSEVIGQQIAEQSQCIAFLQTCVPTVTSCANDACAQCTSLALRVVNSCCAEATSVDCFAAYLDNGSGAAASTTYMGMSNGATPVITPPPAAATTVAAGAIACQSVAEYISICESLTSGFDSLPATEQASCLCYSSTAWQPSVFDGFIASCASYIPATDTSDLLPIESIEGFCSSAGNVIQGGSAGSTTAAALGAGGLTMGSASQQTASVNSATMTAGSSSPSPTATKKSGATKAVSKRGLAILAGVLVMLLNI